MVELTSVLNNKHIESIASLGASIECDAPKFPLETTAVLNLILASATTRASRFIV